MLKNTHGFVRARFSWQLGEDVSKPWTAPGDTLLYRHEESPWALAASQSSVRSLSHAPPVFKKSSWRLQLMENALICSAGQCNFSPNSPLIFDLYLFLLIDKKHNKLHLCFLLTIPSTNYSTTFTWLPNASGALSTRLTTIEQNKCLSFFFFFLSF